MRSQSIIDYLLMTQIQETQGNWQNEKCIIFSDVSYRLSWYQCVSCIWIVLMSKVIGTVLATIRST